MNAIFLCLEVKLHVLLPLSHVVTSILYDDWLNVGTVYKLIDDLPTERELVYAFHMNHIVSPSSFG